MKNSFFKKASLLLTCFLGVYHVYAQQAVAPHMKDAKCDFGCMLQENFRKNYSTIDGCGKGVCFMQFTIHGDGTLNQVAFNEGTPFFMKKFLNEVLQKTNGDWILPKRNLLSDSLTLLIPVNYYLQKCVVPGDTMFLINNTLYFATKIQDNGTPPDTQNVYSFRHMLNFTGFLDNKNISYQSLNCIIFPPVLLELPRF
ncbi:MAG: hypothetical protein JWQ30_241 [Sediminibacterium sp.]|nr:hypothetical protein [Sediminibacterium sp.]